ncbi:gas vesicle protein GvpL [Halostagnicola sp. A-GB9-2]|uniref:gas vesicle protein GvpL n=1 Tax=Halostagnicola sp. A-GB9-2 TaxID=3048066 RepID=UPI0024C02937|nr:GvpL/GvpF family gas vesicle protein [Halostagnicola sp. A-GB9-2]MDJ1431719.1 GvpL/GvpF family gas vesicle protein [Halostagnicola sp. A-GB9-2]
MSRDRAGSGVDAREEPSSQEQQRSGGESDSLPDIEEGRYLYCAVRVDGEDGFQDRDRIELEKAGIDDEPVSVVAVDDIGVVCHDCDGIYDSGDLEQVKRWLVRHQTVVDAAGDRFGTPVPFQFDTIIRTDDAGVREWLRNEYDTLEPTLSELAGHWEYRIEVVETDPIEEERLIERDEQLADLRERIDDSGSGTAHLLEKQYDQRVKQLRADRRESVEADLRVRIDEHVREVHALERSPAATLEDGSEDSAEPSLDSGETLCRFTVLAHEDDESAVGSVLDDVASNPGFAVKFTGPWPPYTFAPELGGEDG